MKLYVWPVGGLFCLLFLVSSCTTVKNIPYFEDLKDTSKIYSQSIKGNYEAHIRPDDVIAIIVSSINPQATSIFNIGNNMPVVPGIAIPNTSTMVTPNNPTTTSTGYLVNKEGVINFPVLGKLQVKDLTINQLKDTLELKLDPYLKNPIVTARLLNYKITVLGEVARPSTYTIQSERVSVVDAIGMAGDLTIFGRRENVLLIREDSGKRNFIRLNLNSSAIFESPYYYLKQNDIVYVEPNKNKVKSTDPNTVRNFAIITSVLTLLIVLATRL